MKPLSSWLWFVQAATYSSIISLNWFNYLTTARLNPPSKFRHSNRLPNQSKKVCIIHHNLSHLNVADNNHRWCLQWAGKNMPLITSNYHITCRQQRTTMTRAASHPNAGPLRNPSTWRNLQKMETFFPFLALPSTYIVPSRVVTRWPMKSVMEPNWGPVIADCRGPTMAGCQHHHISGNLPFSRC